MEYCRNFPRNSWYCTPADVAKLEAAAPNGPMAAFRTLVLCPPSPTYPPVSDERVELPCDITRTSHEDMGVHR
jgi:hypothetical protein